MNQFNGIGRPTKDIELQTAQSGTKFVNFTIAINSKFKNKQTGEYDANFIRCKAFNHTAEFLQKHIKKGEMVGIEGEVQSGSYEDKDGKKVFTTDILVSSVTPIFGQGQNNNAGGQQSNSYTNAYGGNSNSTQGRNEPNPFENSGGPVIQDSDLPF